MLSLWFLVELYQASLKNKGIEANFVYDNEFDITHLDVADFFEHPDGKIYHLIGDGSVPAKEVPNEDEDDATKIYQKYLEECLASKCIILASMSSELYRKHQDMDPTAIIEHLKKRFDTQSRTARYQLSKGLFGFKLTGNSTVGPYVNHMIDLIEELEKLGCKLGKELSQDLIL
ncbi:uncharacterized protein LOC142175375 [Nicotiana tabacum]|uniref:Uncharacterized protein LOC142175375 n=1 Tax=Nicotiana tabacum TaxID=4097 RepID=A0AC58TLF4_TOBAC